MSSLIVTNEADVVRELAAITPGEYLHIGGDEAHATKPEDYLAFEQRVQQTLRSLDVPSREDIDALGARIDALTVELRRRSSARPSGAPAEAPTPRPRARPARPRGSASDPAGGVD